MSPEPSIRGGSCEPASSELPSRRAAPQRRRVRIRDATARSRFARSRSACAMARVQRPRQGPTAHRVPLCVRIRDCVKDARSLAPWLYRPRRLLATGHRRSGGAGVAFGTGAAAAGTGQRNVRTVHAMGVSCPIGSAAGGCIRHLAGCAHDGRRPSQCVEARASRLRALAGRLWPLDLRGASVRGRQQQMGVCLSLLVRARRARACVVRCGSTPSAVRRGGCWPPWDMGCLPCLGCDVRYGSR